MYICSLLAPCSLIYNCDGKYWVLIVGGGIIASHIHVYLLTNAQLALCIHVSEKGIGISARLDTHSTVQVPRAQFLPLDIIIILL